jgi:hypothetical protein
MLIVQSKYQHEGETESFVELGAMIENGNLALLRPQHFVNLAVGTVEISCLNF